jgi:lysozyme
MNKGIPIIRKFEGLKLTAYLCPANVWTIGYGSTFYENGSKVQQGDKITLDRADRLLLEMVKRFEISVKGLVKSKINDNQLGALTSFAFNVGVGALSKSTLLKKVNANPEDPTIRNEFMRWTKTGGKVLKGLVTRREAEANLYFS